VHSFPVIAQSTQLIIMVKHLYMQQVSYLLIDWK
jgi:hypothetical protein